MCFSATASFISGTALCVIGVATLKQTNAPAEVQSDKSGSCPKWGMAQKNNNLLIQNILATAILKKN